LTIDRRLTAVVSSPTCMSTDPLLHSCRSAHTTFLHRRAVRPAMFTYILRLLAEEELWPGVNRRSTINPAASGGGGQHSCKSQEKSRVPVRVCTLPWTLLDVLKPECCCRSPGELLLPFGAGGGKFLGVGFNRAGCFAGGEGRREGRRESASRSG